MYAIIATGGKQYKVSEGDVIRVEKLNVEEGSSVTFDQVLAVSDDGLKVGADITGATVTGTVEKQGKGKKVIRENPATTRKTVTDKHTHRLRLTRSMASVL